MPKADGSRDLLAGEAKLLKLSYVLVHQIHSRWGPGMLLLVLLVAHLV